MKIGILCYIIVDKGMETNSALGQFTNPTHLNPPPYINALTLPQSAHFLQLSSIHVGVSSSELALSQEMGNIKKIRYIAITHKLYMNYFILLDLKKVA